MDDYPAGTLERMSSARMPAARARLHQALTAAGGPSTTAQLIAGIEHVYGRGMTAATADRHLAALAADGQAARIGVSADGQPLWAAASVPPEATAPATPTPAQRILDALDGAGWLDVDQIHAALAATQAGDLTHPDIKTTLRDLVSEGRIERAGLTPPRWRSR